MQPRSDSIDFQPQGYFNGQPFSFDANGGIYSIRDGQLIRYNDFDAFVGILPTTTANRVLLPALLLIYGLLTCISLVVTQRYYSYLPILHDDVRLWARASINVLPSLGLLCLIAFGRASFGYALSFYLATVAAGYSWLLPFSVFTYDKDLATLSIFLTLGAFILPAVFLSVHLPRPPALSDRAINRLLMLVLTASALILVVSSTYHFRLVGLGNIYDHRNDVVLPAALRYGCGIAVGALLPYAFAMFAARGRWSLVLLTAALQIGFYPVNLMKLSLFAPFWLVYLLLLFRFAEERTAVVLSLLLPLSVGLATMAPRAFGIGELPTVTSLFGIINFRMLAVPAISLDLYNDFFHRNPLTNFRQISWIKQFVQCPYPAALSETLEREYQFGNLNASLLATEGIASVGPLFAPGTAALCGLAVAVANGFSRHWPQRFVILSAGVALQSFTSVPFTTMMLSNGAAVLFLLWYLTPSSYFRQA